MNWKALIIVALILAAGITSAYFLAKAKNNRNSEGNAEKPLTTDSAAAEENKDK